MDILILVKKLNYFLKKNSICMLNLPIDVIVIAHFCLRHLKNDHKLWLKDGEPSLEEIKQAFLNAPMENVADIVICGFGEPTMRFR